jgi:hypothetical protein
MSFLDFHIVQQFKIDINEFSTDYEHPVLDPSITDNRFTANSNFDVSALYRNKIYAVQVIS